MMTNDQLRILAEYVYQLAEMVNWNSFLDRWESTGWSETDLNEALKALGGEVGMDLEVM